jgi:hypothetical protein
VTKKKIYKFLQTHPITAHFSNARKSTEFQLATVMRPGVYQIDYDYWFMSNKGSTGFLVAVENFTNKLFAVPSRGKGTKQWLKAISEFVENTRNVRVILSDRDSVAKSSKFRKRIQQDYNIKWLFLRKGHKAYLAERYVRFLKTKLSQALRQKGGKSWVDFLREICKEYNRSKVEGTSFRRQAVNQANFSQFLSQLLKTKEPELLFNSSKAGPFVQESWNKKIFKFDLGQKVLIARRANWKSVDDKMKTFTKISTVGGFGKNVYTVGGRQLRGSKGGKSYVPMYSINELGPSLHFYSHELKPAPLL